MATEQSVDGESDAAAPRATPVGHQGARVEVVESKAGSVGGSFAVLVIAVCIVGAIVIGATAPRSFKGLLVVPVLIGVVVLASLVVVSPGQARVVQFFGRYIGTVRKPACPGSRR